MKRKKLKKLYKEFNKKYFKYNYGELPNKIKIKFFHTKDSWGYCDVENNIIYLYKYMSTLEMRSTLLHEMIHIWQWVYIPKELAPTFSTIKYKKIDKKIHKGNFKTICRELEKKTDMGIR